AHVSFADPVCPILAGALYEAAKRVLPGDEPGARAHQGGTYVCIEGPQFSTRAESRVYRSWGVSVIGMTNMPEAKLAREAELPFATLALSTDYDCWHDTEEDVNVAAVVATLMRNVSHAKEIARVLAGALPALKSRLSDSPARSALRGAIMTNKALIPSEARTTLDWL